MQIRIPDFQYLSKFIIKRPVISLNIKYDILKFDEFIHLHKEIHEKKKLNKIFKV